MHATLPVAASGRNAQTTEMQSGDTHRFDRTAEPQYCVRTQSRRKDPDLRIIRRRGFCEFHINRQSRLFQHLIRFKARLRMDGGVLRHGIIPFSGTYGNIKGILIPYVPMKPTLYTGRYSIHFFVNVILRLSSVTGGTFPARRFTILSM